MGPDAKGYPGIMGVLHLKYYCMYWDILNLIPDILNSMGVLVLEHRDSLILEYVRPG